MPNPISDKLDYSKIPEPAKIITAMVIGAALLLFSIHFLFPGSDNIEIGFPNGNLQIKVQNNHIDYKALLTKVFDDDFSKAGALNWLNKRNIYEIYDPKLPAKFAEIFPSKFNSNNWADVASKLDSLLNKYIVIKDLRKRAEQKESPFQYIGKKITIGIPSTEDQPQNKYVNVGFESEFCNKVIVIKNPVNKKELVLWGNPAFPKIEGELFQLNNKQAKFLFSKIISTDSAVAYIVPSAKITDLP